VKGSRKAGCLFPFQISLTILQYELPGGKSDFSDHLARAAHRMSGPEKENVVSFALDAPFHLAISSACAKSLESRKRP
jgi:hypothetical protein